MENIKVKVNNEAESKEVQELFFELGYDFYFGGKLYCNTHLGLVTANKEGLMANIELDGFEYKELTIQQLKDMVVLKRNSLDDATHVGKSGSQYYIGDKSYFWDGIKWDQRDFAYIANLKPIKEKEMKEFLVKQGDKWTLQLLDSDTEENSYRVAVPSGAIEARLNKGGSLNFIRKDGCWMNNATKGEWRGARSHDCHELVWQRPQQPEELPFIDDEPKIETATGYQLDVVGKNTYGSRGRNDGESDISYRQYLMNFILYNKRKSLNDTYAEIEQIRQDTVKVTIDELKHRANDKVNNPSHYSDSTIECIDAMEAMLSPQEFIGYLRGNMFKYQWRYQKKNGIEDLQKSEWYLKKLIEKEIENEDE